MWSIDRIGGQSQIKSAEFKGLSTDIKPIERVPNGSSFYEMDTQKVYLFDAQNKRWIEQ